MARAGYEDQVTFSFFFSFFGVYLEPEAERTGGGL